MNAPPLRAAGLVTMAFGLLALLGWVLGWMPLASFGADRVPMAPSTAALFLLYGAALGVRARAPLSSLAHRFSAALAGLGLLAALVLFTLGWRQVQWAGEHLGLEISGTVQGAPLGHMSVVTAVCFVLAGVSFLASLSPAPLRRWRVGLALAAAGVLLATSFVFLLAYGFGTPLLYGSGFIPPALNTILAFSTLGLALLASAGGRGGLVGSLPGDDSRPALVFVLIFLVLALGIVSTGYAYYRDYERHFRAEAEGQLSSIAELKVGELTRYRKERLSDGAVLRDNPAFTRLVRRFLATPADVDALRQLQAWLGKYQNPFQYDQIRLLDAQGITRLSVPAGLAPASVALSRSASEALRSGQVMFQDFYRDELDQRVSLAVLIPILDEAGADRPLGVVIERIDPSAFLYPFISRWPVPSATAETLLVRKEGNEVVFLNELRFQANTALTLRRSLAHIQQPAVMAALGHEGVVAGLDYRGVPVLAAVRAVPESPWFLVARRDVTDVYAPLRTQLWQMVALVGGLLFGAGAAVGLVWRQQRVRFYRELAMAAESLQRTQSLLTQAEKLGRVGGWEFDIDSRQMIWTEAVFDIHELDCTSQPTVEQGISFYTPASRPIIERAVQRAIEQGEPFDVELEILTAKGNRRSVHSVGQVDLPRRKVAGFFQDITERKQAEAERQKLGMVVDSSSEFIGMCDLDMQPLYVNPAGLRLVGLPDLAAACQVKVQDYFFPEDQRFIAEEFFPRVLRDGHGDVEIRLRHFQTGEPIWMYYYLFSVRDGSGESIGWATVSRDITERRQAEESLRRSRQAALNLMTDAIEARDRSERAEAEIVALNAHLETRVLERTAQLEAANRELEAFSYSVSHDLRAPLRAVDGYARILEEDYRDRLDAEGRRVLGVVRGEAQRMGILIDELLAFSRLGRRELRRQKLDMRALAREVFDELQLAEPGRPVELRLGDLPITVADPVLLRQVWANLIGNAFKYTRGREPARIEVSGSVEGDCAHYSVSDNGVGFAMAHADKLFGVFQRLHGEDEFEGHGVGLALVQRIVHRHGGRVSARAEVGVGAHFQFTLPARMENAS